MRGRQGTAERSPVARRVRDRLSRASVVAGALLLLSCGGGGSGNGGSVGGLVTANTGPRTLTRVQVTLPASAMLVGESMTATATGFDQLGAPMTIGTPVWSTSSPAVARTTSTGVVTGVAAGNITVNAAVDGLQGQVALAVLLPQVSRILLAPALLPLAVGTTQSLAVTLLDARGSALTGRTIAWSSSAPAVASVSAAAVVTAIAPGTTTLTATSDGASATTLVTVTAQLAPVARVALTPSVATVAFGQTLQLVAELRDASGAVLRGRPVTWSSSAPTVASVSETGLVTVVTAGTAQVTVTSEGQSATAVITTTEDVVVEIASPNPKTVAAETLDIVVFVKSRNTPNSVVASIGSSKIALALTPIGALGGSWAWTGHMDLTWMAWGAVEIDVTATDSTGASGSSFVVFTHDPTQGGGGIIGDKKSKSLVPVVKKRIP